MRMTDFIEETLDLYDDFFPFEINLKLKILKLAREGYKLSSIKAFIEDECNKAKSNCSKEKKDDINKLQKKYIDCNDNKKISRITGKEASERFKKIPSLIYFIGVDCFVLATLKKFPFPVVVGFPYNSWTPELMRNYIRLFFHMGKTEEFRQKHNQKLPPLNSIRNCLNSHPEYYKLDVSSIEILDFYLSNKNNLFFMLQFVMEKNFYKELPLRFINNTPNATCTLKLYIYDSDINRITGNSDKLEDALPNHKISFSAKTKSYDLTSFFNTARKDTTNTDKLGRQKQPVYLINTDTISLKSYYNKLKDIPFMQIFLINDFYDFSKIIIEKIHCEKKKKKNSNTQPTAKEYEKAFSNIIKTFYEIEKKI